MERPFSCAKIYTALNKEYKAILLEKLYSFYDEKSGLCKFCVVFCLLPKTKGKRGNEKEILI